MYLNHDFAEPLALETDLSPEEALAKLYQGLSLTAGEAQCLFEALVAGHLPEPAIAAMLVALRLKGETAEEMIGAARALRAADAPFDRPSYLFADSCGTGGDGSCSINVSTAVAFVAAACGLPVAKHGNRSVTSAEPDVQLLGVADPGRLEPVARTLAALGVRRALVVHGAGLDEVALHAESQAVRGMDGTFEHLTITPEAAGLARAPVEGLKGGGPEENAQRLKALLKGCGSRIETDIVALNTGTLLMAAGLCSSLREGTDLAAQALASGDAFTRLTAFVEATHA